MLSIPHLLLLMLIALVVLGPDKLPEVARAMGKAMAELRRVTGDFRYQIDNEMRDLERQARLRELAQEKDIYEFRPPDGTPPELLPPDPTIAPPPPAEFTHGGVTPSEPAAAAPELAPAAPDHEHAGTSAGTESHAHPDKPGEPHPA